MHFFCRKKDGNCAHLHLRIPNAQNMLTTVNYQEGEKVTVLCKENYAFLEAKELCAKVDNGSPYHSV